MSNIDSVHSQGKSVRQFKIKVLNSHNEEIKNASVFIDDIKATYDTITSNYLLKKESTQTFDLKIICQGYDTLHYTNLDHKFAIGQIYLIQPVIDYYYLQDGIKISYPLRPFEIYIHLNPYNKEGIYMSPEHAIESIGNLLDSLGLYISYSSYSDTNLLKYESESINNQSAFSKYVVIVKRKDGLKFDLKNSPELKALRLSPLVKIAGSLILHDNENKFLSYTHGNRIKFTINPKVRNEDITDFLVSIGLNRLEPNLNIIELPYENAIGVIEFAEKLSKSNLFNSVAIDVYYNAFID